MSTAALSNLSYVCFGVHRRGLCLSICNGYAIFVCRFSSQVMGASGIRMAQVLSLFLPGDLVEHHDSGVVSWVCGNDGVAA